MATTTADRLPAIKNAPTEGEAEFARGARTKILRRLRKHVTGYEQLVIGHERGWTKKSVEAVRAMRDRLNRMQFEMRKVREIADCQWFTKRAGWSAEEVFEERLR